jgi:hypothetical protein
MIVCPRPVRTWFHSLCREKFLSQHKINHSIKSRERFRWLRSPNRIPSQRSLFMTMGVKLHPLSKSVYLWLPVLISLIPDFIRIQTAQSSFVFDLGQPNAGFHCAQQSMQECLQLLARISRTCHYCRTGGGNDLSRRLLKGKPAAETICEHDIVGRSN